MDDHGITPESLTGIPGVDSRVSQQNIDAAVASIRHLCGWHVWPVREETVRVDSPGDFELFLPTLNLLELKSVRVRGAEIPLDQIDWSEDGYLRWRSRRFPVGLGAVEVTMRHGYDSPHDLMGVVGLMAGRATQSGQSLAVGAISVGGASSLTPQATEWRILDLYKLGPMP